MYTDKLIIITIIKYNLLYNIISSLMHSCKKYLCMLISKNIYKQKKKHEKTYAFAINKKAYTHTYII